MSINLAKSSFEVARNFLVGGNLIEVFFYGFCFFVLIYQGWKGWHLGVVRSTLRLLALTLSAIVGWEVGVLVAGVVEKWLAGVGIFGGLLVGLAVGVSIYVLLNLVAAFFFKKTGDNRPFFIRFFYGVGGMVAGLAVGVLYIWAIVTFVRAGGGIFDAKGSGNGLAELRRHLEKGAASAIIQHADPIPQKTYDLVAKTTRVLTSPEALVAFFETKEMSPLMKYPKFVALIQDEKIQKYASERDYVGIISSPKLHELLTDPEFLEILKKIDYEGAVDRALRHTEPVPSQIPKERFE